MYGDADRIVITILADGTIRSVTDTISPANHSNADSFLLDVQRLAGGSTVETQREDVSHAHAHTHEHLKQH